MRKMLLLLASLACFGLLASCSDETQDFNDVNVSKKYFYVGNVTGTITVLNNPTTHATFPTGNIATMEYTKTPLSNNIDYTLTVNYKDTELSESLNKETIIIVKIDDKYYNKVNSNYIEVKVDGSLENSQFTISSITGSKILLSNLKFTRS